MSDRRAAIALLATVCTTFTGCLTPGIRKPFPAPSTAKATSTRIEPNHPRARPVEIFTIAFATFIPGNYLLGPFIHPQSYSGIAPPMRLAFAGDDRGFNVNAPTFRAKQIVTVIPNVADDADGLLDGSKQNLGGFSESFLARPALADGRIDDRDRRGVSDGRKIKYEEIPVDTSGMIIDDPVRLGPYSVRIRLRTAPTGGPRNRLVLGSPSIDWDIRITIDTSGPEPIYEVAGSWDGYPAAELYINKQPVFTFTPGNGPSSIGDLVKLLPGYGDLGIVRKGTLNQSAVVTSQYESTHDAERRSGKSRLDESESPPA